MKIFLDRHEADQYGTRSVLTIDGRARGFVLEPAGPHGASGRLRIAAGTYAIELKPVGTSKFDAEAKDILAKAGKPFHGMPRLVDVPGRSEILIHWGNFWQDSEGCLLVGSSTMNGRDGSLAVGMSRQKFAELYPEIAQAALSLNASITLAPRGDDA